MESDARFRDRAPKAWAGEGACREAEKELAGSKEEEEARDESLCSEGGGPELTFRSISDSLILS